MNVRALPASVQDLCKNPRRLRRLFTKVMGGALGVILLLRGSAMAQNTPASTAPLTLTEKVEAQLPPTRSHRISFPLESKPAKMEGLFWVEEAPGQKPEASELHSSSFLLRTPANGQYHVYVEERRGQEARRLSNVLVVTVADIPAGGPGAAPEPQPAQQAAFPWDGFGQRFANAGHSAANIIHGVNPLTYKEVGDKAALLVGFEIVMTPFGQSQETVRGVAPLYLTKDGDLKGLTYGSHSSADVRRVVAKSGYAVGGVTAQFDDTAIRRLKVRFERIRGLALDTTDSYETEWYSIYPGLQEEETSANGKLPVGITGRSGWGLDSLGLMYLNP